MYPFIWIRLRKLIKGVWYRHNTSNRERTTLSSLQKCSDHQPVHKGPWRKWFLLLPLVPLVYYVTYIKVLWDDEMYRAAASRSISHHIPENVTESLSSLAKPTNDSEFVKSTPLISKKVPKNYTDSIPWCEYKVNTIQNTEVKFNNLSLSQWYRQMVEQGGIFKPLYCKPRHKVAIIVPYRDRSSNLAVFLLTIHPFLIDQLLDYRIFVVEQSGKELFNKGRLLNVGYVQAMKLRKWDCLIFHDVDLLPMNKLILYSCPLWPRHMCSTLVERGKNMWNLHSYFGGVSSMSTKHFVNVNGFSNLYWGWGGEDTDMFWRIKGAGLSVTRYKKDVAKYLVLPHKKSPECINRYELIKTAIRRYPHDGLTTLTYIVLSMKLFNLYTYILVNVNPIANNATFVPRV